MAVADESLEREIAEIDMARANGRPDRLGRSFDRRFGFGKAKIDFVRLHVDPDQLHAFLRDPAQPARRYRVAGLQRHSVAAAHLAYVRDPDGHKLCALYRPKVER